MIRKLKRRYFISNMALLSTTLLIGLGVLFGILYRSEVNTSYSLMNQMIERSELSETTNENGFTPTAYYMDDENTGSFEDGWQPYPVPNPWGQQDTDNPEGMDWNWFDWYPNEPATTTPYWEDLGNDYPWAGEWWWDIEPISTQTEPTTTQPAETTAVTETEITEAMTQVVNKKYKNGQQLVPGWLPIGPIIKPQPPKDDKSTETTYTTASAETTTTTVTKAKKDGKKENDKPDAKDKGPANNRPKKDKAAAEADNDVNATESTTTKPVIVVMPKATPAEAENLKPQTPDALIARIDENGNIEVYDDQNAASEASEPNISTEALSIANQAMQQIDKDGANSGTFEANNKSYRYLKRESHLVMLNRTLELSSISRLMFIFTFLGVIGLLGVFIVSELLANWTVRPISLAWEKQKQFVADASHELKTPLAVISANTEVIMSNPEASVTGQSKWIHYIQSETTRMSKLITNLLSIARMDHKTESEPVTVLQASDLVANVCLVFEPIAFENGKILNCDIEENLTVRGDEDNLKQFLSILLDNAVIHSAPNAEISVTLAKDALGKIRLTVANSAKDIPQEQLEHLFDRFYRLDTEGNPNGSGLGLSIAKSIVTQMGGTLTATSENNLVTFTALI